jgi:hypothetical protein
MREVRSCWVCYYRRYGEDRKTLGKCGWFSENLRGEDKEIPLGVGVVGCSKFKKKGI